MAKIRLNIEVSHELADLIDSLATTEDTTRTEIVRRSLSVLKAFREQQAVGRTHLGFTADPRSLDAEMLGILDATPRNDVETHATMKEVAATQPSPPPGFSHPASAEKTPVAA
jgi:hypothetical protein